MRRLLTRLVRNWQLKLLSFALALLLWGTVSADQVMTTDLDLPLEVSVADPGYRVDPASIPAQASVTLRGPRAEIGTLRSRRPPVRVRLNEVADTTDIVFLEPDMVEVPLEGQVRVLALRPQAIQLRFQRLTARAIPVRVNISEGPAAGWVIAEGPTVTPATVTVRGPAAVVRGIDSLTTTAIDLSETDTVFARNVAIDTTALRGAELIPPRVQVRGRVDRLVEREMADIDVSVGSGVAVRPQVVTATLRGPASVVESLTPEEVRIVVSIDSIPGRLPLEGMVVPLRVDRLPPGVQADLSPAAVRLFPAANAATLAPGPVEDSVRPREPSR